MGQGRQRTWDNERLKKETRALDQGIRDLERAIVPVGSIWLFPDRAELGLSWHLCNGQRLLRKTYPRLAAALGGAAVTDADVELPAIVAPAGLDYRIWGPPG